MAEKAGLAVALCFAATLAAADGLSASQFMKDFTETNPAHGVEMWAVRDRETGGEGADDKRIEEGLILLMNGGSANTLRAVAKYPIVHLEITGGTLDLNNLKGMDVHSIKLFMVEISGPEEIIGTLPLRSFDVELEKPWRDVAALARIETLESLRFSVSKGTSHTEIAKLAELQNLRKLSITGSWGPDASWLSGMKLTQLELIGNSAIANWSVLKGLPLTHLDLRDSSVADISFVAGMPLTYLDLTDTPVSDISALQGLSLKQLRLTRSHVTDISPLRGSPLEILLMEKCKVRDVSPLAGMKLGTLIFDISRVEKGLGVIRQMTSLTSIGTIGDYRSYSTDVATPAEFWQRHNR